MGKQTRWSNVGASSDASGRTGAFQGVAHAAGLAPLPQIREGAGGPWRRAAARGFAAKGAQDRRVASPVAWAAAEERGGPGAPPSGPAAHPPLPGFLGREGGPLLFFCIIFFEICFFNCDKIRITKKYRFNYF